MLEIKGWNGEVIRVETKQEAIAAIKRYLNQWSQEGDHLVWQKVVTNLHAYVVNKDGIDTDASCRVIDFWKER
jgi:hypothetical protein